MAATDRPERTRGRLSPVVAAATSLALVGGGALIAAGVAAEDSAAPAPAPERAPLPEGSDEPGRVGAETSARELAAALDAVAGPEEGEACADDALEVSWDEPEATPESGAWTEPVGPAPDEDSERVNGLVRCGDSDRDVAGFQASWDGERWSVALVPDLAAMEEGTEHDHESATGPEGEGEGDAGAPDDDGETDGEGDEGGQPDAGSPEPSGLLDPLDALLPEAGGGEAGGDEAGGDEAGGDEAGGDEAGGDEAGGDEAGGDEPDEAEAEAPDPEAEPTLPGETPGVLGEDSPWVGLWDSAPEPLAAYEPQQLCSPSAKPGTAGFRNLVLRAYPDTGDSGISRACWVGGRSEHKEGRAWDWTVSVHDDAERQAAAEVIGWLLAADEDGHEHAMARRLGVMYVIFNGNIWSAYQSEAGWQPYVGRSDHTDHVHLSFSEAGGLAQTSFWDVPELEELVGNRFGPAAILPEYGGGIGYADPSEEGPAPAEGDPGSLTPPAPPPTSAPQPGGGGGGTPGPAPSPAPDGPSPPPPPSPNPTLPPVTLPRPPDLGPIGDVVDPVICGLLPCPTGDP